MRWELIIPWILTAVSVAISIFVVIRTRIPFVKISCALQQGNAEHNTRYMRFLTVDLASYGADLYDVSILLCVTVNGETKRRRMNVGTDLSKPHRRDEAPSPFKMGQSRIFFLTNDNPHEQWEIQPLQATEIWVEVKSGTRELRRIGDGQIRPLVTDFAKPDHSMPPRPRVEVYGSDDD